MFHLHTLTPSFGGWLPVREPHQMIWNPLSLSWPSPSPFPTLPCTFCMCGPCLKERSSCRFSCDSSSLTIYPSTWTFRQFTLLDSTATSSYTSRWCSCRCCRSEPPHPPSIGADPHKYTVTLITPPRKPSQAAITPPHLASRTPVFYTLFERNHHPPGK